MLRSPQWLLALALALTPAWYATAQTSPQPPALKFTVNSFQVYGENPLSPELTEKSLAPFLGEYSGIEGLLEAANTLEQALLDKGYSFYRVILPPQTLQRGEISLEVVAFKIGKVIIKGNKFFSDENVRRAMPSLQSGQRPDPAQHSRERYVANLHPSRQIELRFKESETEQAVDAYLDVRDTKINSFFIGFDNTGNEETGDYRTTFGYQNSNWFGYDGQLTASFTVSPSSLSSVRQLGANYVLPLYSLGGTLSAYISDSDVDSGTISFGSGTGGLDVSGAGRFLGVSYTQYLARSGGYTQQLTLGFDDKRFVNNTVDVTNPIPPINVRSRPISLSYNGNYEFTQATAGFYLSYARNLPSGNLNEKVHYTANRIFDDGVRGADHIWDVLRLGAQADYQFSNRWLLRWRADGQLTDEPLISGEQFGIGGARSVRGYDERVVAGDVGLFSSIEVWSPPLGYDIRAIGFFDSGQARSKNVLFGEEKVKSLFSYGAGLRWYFKSNVSAELDVAKILNDAGTDSNDPNFGHLNNRGDIRASFNLFMRY